MAVKDYTTAQLAALVVRGVVVASLQVTSLHLVNAVGLQRPDPGDVAHLGGGLHGTHRQRMHQQAGRLGPQPGEVAGLLAAQRGELGARRPGVEPAVDVAVGLAVPDQQQTPAHLTGRPCAADPATGRPRPAAAGSRRPGCPPARTPGSAPPRSAGAAP